MECFDTIRGTERRLSHRQLKMTALTQRRCLSRSCQPCLAATSRGRNVERHWKQSFFQTTQKREEKFKDSSALTVNELTGFLRWMKLNWTSGKRIDGSYQTRCWIRTTVGSMCFSVSNSGIEAASDTRYAANSRDFVSVRISVGLPSSRSASIAPDCPPALRTSGVWKMF